jgi:periplasmic copper chaperone A
LIAIAASALPVCAEVIVTDAWVRGTVAQQTATGAYMQLKADRDASVVEVRSPVAGMAQVHEMSMAQGRMTMGPVDSLALPAGKVVELKPGGYHIMLMQLKRPLKEGESIPIALVIENADHTKTTVDAKATVRSLTARP